MTLTLSLHAISQPWTNKHRNFNACSQPSLGPFAERARQQRGGSRRSFANELQQKTVDGSWGGELVVTPNYPPELPSTVFCSQLNPSGHVLLDRRDGAVDLVGGIVEMRREAQAGAILACARRANNLVVGQQRRAQLPWIERPGLEDDDGRRVF